MPEEKENDQAESPDQINAEPEIGAEQDASTKPTCGIVMPISALDGCTSSHWSKVKAILEEGIQAAGFDPRTVSDSEDTAIIQRTIVQNLHNNELIVCDVSGRDPNIMFEFELGLRLAFDKPVVTVKDDATDYSFDTSPIEHLEYPRSLDYHQIIDFKNRLKDKIKATHQSRPIRVMLVDDHLALREGLAGMIRAEEDLEIVAEAGDGKEAVDKIGQVAPDVVVMDVSMPRMNGIEATRRIVDNNPGTRVIGLSIHRQDDLANSMLEAGASAYVSKGGPSDDVLRVIRQTYVT